MSTTTFEKLTIAILASTEQQSLKKTVDLLTVGCSPDDLAEIIIFLISEDCPSASAAREIAESGACPVPVRCHVQQMPGFSQAIHEIGELVRSSHFLIIGSDLEMDPRSVPDLIRVSKKHPEAIVCASKFLRGSTRRGYGFLHCLGNRAVNAAACLILGRCGTELIATFQIYPTALYRRMRFTDPANTFYEFTVRPLCRGAGYIEIPTSYRRRREGESNFNPRKYLRLGFTFLKTAQRERRAALRPIRGR